MRSKSVDRFNKAHTPFLKDFQEVMLERINLNYDGSYSKAKADKLIRNILNQNPACLSLRIKDGFVLSCKVEPEIYLRIQETCKKINDSVMPMDELIHMLLVCFILTYHNVPKPVLPFRHTRKGLRFNNLRKFQSRFSKYYHNSTNLLP